MCMILLRHSMLSSEVVRTIPSCIFSCKLLIQRPSFPVVWNDGNSKLGLRPVTKMCNVSRMWPPCASSSLQRAHIPHKVHGGLDPRALRQHLRYHGTVHVRHGREFGLVRLSRHGVEDVHSEQNLVAHELFAVVGGGGVFVAVRAPFLSGDGAADDDVSIRE
mmetsp:Transcript_2677/g.5847  ORF Transcript_2677/g.5847 Transcript_2677/m.5847 type:complete len:162 (-) Transcript_2677:672-1157(-)